MWSSSSCVSVGSWTPPGHWRQRPWVTKDAPPRIMKHNRLLYSHATAGSVLADKKHDTAAVAAVCLSVFSLSFNKCSPVHCIQVECTKRAVHLTIPYRRLFVFFAPIRLWLRWGDMIEETSAASTGDYNTSNTRSASINSLHCNSNDHYYASAW